MPRFVHLVPLAALALSAASARAQSYHVAHRLRAGGEGGWDYLVADTARHRLFVTRGTHVMVLDTDRDSVVGDIPDTPGVHGVALAPELGRGFTSNGRDSSVTIFDYATLATIAVVKVTGRNPDAIMYDPATRRVFTFNGGSGDATALDAATGRVLGTIALAGKPEEATYDGRGHAFVNLEDKGEVVEFDPATLAVQAHWPVRGCEEPTGQAIDRANARLYVACGNGVMAVLNAQSGALVTTAPIGRGVDGNGFDAATRLAFSSNGADGTVTVLRADTPDRLTVVATVPTQRGARTMTVDPRTHRVYTVTAEFGPAPVQQAGQPRQRPPMVAGSFTVLVLEP